MVALLGAHHNGFTRIDATVRISFLFIFLGAPYVERLRGNTTLAGILSGITAAVVGVIANLALYFVIHTFFSHTDVFDWGPVHLQAPDPATVNPAAVVIAAAASLLIFTFRFSALRTIGVCAALGLAAGLIGIPLG